MRTKKQVGKGVRGNLGFSRRSTIWCYDNKFNSLSNALSSHIDNLKQSKDPDVFAVRLAISLFEIYSMKPDSEDKKEAALYLAEELSTLMKKIKNDTKFRSSANECAPRKTSHHTTNMTDQLYTLIINKFAQTELTAMMHKAYLLELRDATGGRKTRRPR